MISLGYILQFFIHLAFSSSNYGISLSSIWRFWMLSSVVPLNKKSSFIHLTIAEFNILDEISFAFPCYIHITSLLLNVRWFFGVTFSISSSILCFPLQRIVISLLSIWKFWMLSSVLSSVLPSLPWSRTRTSSAFCEGRAKVRAPDAMAAAMLSNHFREEKKIDALLRVDGIFPECLLLASVLCLSPHFFRVTSSGLEDEVFCVYHQALDLNPFWPETFLLVLFSPPSSSFNFTSFHNYKLLIFSFVDLGFRV